MLLSLLPVLSASIALAAPLDSQARDSGLVLGSQTFTERDIPNLNYGPLLSPDNFGDNSCGDSSFIPSDDAVSCGIDDCNSLVTELRKFSGSWLLNDGGGTAGWTFVVGFGTCNFYVDRTGMLDPNAGGSNLGTGDVADLVGSTVAGFSEYGTVNGPGYSVPVSDVRPVQGSMLCEPYAPQNVPWRIQQFAP